MSCYRGDRLRPTKNFQFPTLAERMFASSHLKDLGRCLPDSHLKPMIKRLLTFSILALQFSIPLSASEPSLARLSFLLPAEQHEAFAKTYQEKLLPILKGNGLIESTRSMRASVDSVFSRLFEFDSPGQIEGARRTLRDDQKWVEQLNEVGLRRRYYFNQYSSPAGTGQLIETGPAKDVPAGRGLGLWRNYDAADGLATVEVRAVIQDGRGHLWFGTWGGGVSRYDGRTFTTYTKKEVLDPSVFSIVEDREGNIWIPDGRRISRYDGQSWTHITNEIFSEAYRAYVDREGGLWLAVFEGVVRYDASAPPETAWTLFARDDLGGRVAAIHQDREGISGLD